MSDVVAGKGILHSDADLDGLYASPPEAVIRAITGDLHDFHIAYLKVATFFCVATGREVGLDASPRGGPPGFVRALDRQTIAFADWPGNNRIETMRNLVQDDRVALLFIFPGLEVFMRINGRAHLSTDPELLKTLAEGQRVPKAATVVRTHELIFHCGKAINRSRLWAPESQIDKRGLPTVGQILVELGKVQDAAAEELTEHYDHAVRTDLY
jgi:PPOX class probable FMN-dependent enzyme